MYIVFFILFGCLILYKNTEGVKENICVNCKHFINTTGCSEKYGRCRIFPKKVDDELEYLVSGKRKLEYRFCNFVREDENSCGKKGKYFEPKIFNFVNPINKLKDLKNKFVNYLNNNDIENIIQICNEPIIKSIYSNNYNINNNSENSDNNIDNSDNNIEKI